MQSGQFVPLGCISLDLVKWVRGGWGTKTLVLYGLGGLGKTELACVLAYIASPAKAFHFVNKVDRIRDVSFSPGEALVIDEACFAERDVDDAKALIDLEKSRDVTCRNKDGHIYRGTPRVLSTNWCWEQFWPSTAFADAHAWAIKRRVLWVNVTTDVRKIAAVPTSMPGLVATSSASTIVPELVVSEEEEDPLGLGCNMGS